MADRTLPVASLTVGGLEPVIIYRSVVETFFHSILKCYSKNLLNKVTELLLYGQLLK